MATLAQRGSGTPVTSGTTWTTTTSVYDGAPGTNPNTNATWTSTTSGATGYIECTGYAFSSVPADATVTSVSIDVRYSVSQATRMASGFAQLYDGATTIGAQQTLTVTSTTPATTTFVRNPTLAQLKSGTFKVRVSFTRTAVTQACNALVDYVDITATLTAPLKSGTATATHTWTASAAGVKPVEPPLTGTAAVTWAEVVTATGTAPFVLVPNTGSAAVTYTEAAAATGKRVPKATATTIYAEAVTATGRKTQKSAVTVAWTDVVAVTGKRIPKSAVVATYSEAVTATGVKPVVEFPNEGSTAVSYTYTVTAGGIAPVSIVGYLTMEMQFGSQPVVAWQMDGQGAPV